jgi:hypothetical protein
VTATFDGGSASAWRTTDDAGGFEVAFRPPAGFTGAVRVSAVASEERTAGSIEVVTTPEAEPGTSGAGRDVVPTTGAPAAATVEPVKTGLPVYTVPAEIPGDCSTDVTQAILGWIQSVPDNSMVVFTEGACYRVDSTLELTDRHGLVIEGNSATFRAFVEAPDHTNRAQWYLEYGSDITLRDMSLVGVNPEAAFDEAHEWDHNLFIRGTQTVTVENVHGRNAHGDFIAIAQGPDDSTIPSDITIRRVSGDTTGRMGISCVACDGLTVEDSVFNNIAYHAFDLEIQGDGWPGRDVRYTGNTVGSHGWAFFSVGTPYLTRDNDVSGVVITGNTVTMPGTGVDNCLPAISFRSSKYHTSGVTITDNTLLSHTDAILVRLASDAVIRNNTATLAEPICGDPAGVRTVDVEPADVRDNDMTGYRTALDLE